MSFANNSRFPALKEFTYIINVEIMLVSEFVTKKIPYDKSRLRNRNLFFLKKPKEKKLVLIKSFFKN